MADFWSKPTHTGGDDCTIIYGQDGEGWLRLLYWLRNLRPLRCRKLGYRCDWIYPYGFIPEAGCPYHD